MSLLLTNRPAAFILFAENKNQSQWFTQFFTCQRALRKKKKKHLCAGVLKHIAFFSTWFVTKCKLFRKSNLEFLVSALCLTALTFVCAPIIGRRTQNSAGLNFSSWTFYIDLDKCTSTLPLLIFSYFTNFIF